MAPNVHELRPKPADTEKITINLGYVDLGHVDLMVQEGFYSNRTDFIRTAIRNQLERLPLVVMLHGCTQSPDDFAAGTRMNFIAEEQTCFVVYPAQRSEANQAKCWNRT